MVWSVTHRDCHIMYALWYDGRALVKGRIGPIGVAIQACFRTDHCRNALDPRGATVRGRVVLGASIQRFTVPTTSRNACTNTHTS